MRWRRLPPVAAIAVSLVLVACGGSSPPTTGPTVVVTTTILGDVVRNVVGDRARVEVLMPAGADPHEFEASARQVANVESAELVVTNGLDLEQGMTGVLAAAKHDGANVFEVGPELDPIPLQAGATRCDPAVELGSPQSCNPHVWMDPLRMADAARLIAEQLTAIDPSGGWESRAAVYGDQLIALDTEIRDTLAPVVNRNLVTMHESLSYFAARYDFTVLGVIIPGGSDLAEPNSEALAGLATTIRSHQLPAIFAETTEPTTFADALAAEAGPGVDVVVLYTDSLGEPGTGADSLIGMLRVDAQLIADAFS